MDCQPCLSVKINEINQEHETFILKNDLFLTHRTFKLNKISQIVDAYGPSWIIYFGKMSEGKVFINSNGDWINLFQNKVVFAPPFSIVEWKILPGYYEWWGIHSDRPLSQMPSYSCVLDISDDFKVTDRSSIENFLNHSHKIFAEKCFSPMPLSLKLKRLIDENYTFEIKIKDIVKKMKASYATIHNSFINDFGISPNEYLRRVRFFNCTDQITCRGNNIFDSAIKSGLNNYSQIYRLFKDITDQSPECFSWGNAKIVTQPNLQHILPNL